MVHKIAQPKNELVWETGEIGFLFDILDFFLNFSSTIWGGRLKLQLNEVMMGEWNGDTFRCIPNFLIKYFGCNAVALFSGLVCLQ